MLHPHIAQIGWNITGIDNKPLALKRKWARRLQPESQSMPGARTPDCLKSRDGIVLLKGNVHRVRLRPGYSWHSWQTTYYLDCGWRDAPRMVPVPPTVQYLQRTPIAKRGVCNK